MASIEIRGVLDVELVEAAGLRVSVQRRGDEIRTALRGNAGILGGCDIGEDERLGNGRLDLLDGLVGEQAVVALMICRLQRDDLGAGVPHCLSRLKRGREIDIFHVSIDLPDAHDRQVDLLLDGADILG